MDTCAVCLGTNIVLSPDRVLNTCVNCGFTRVSTFINDESKYSVGHYETIRTSLYSFLAYFVDALIININHIKGQDKILDFGCGKGIHLKLFSHFHKDLTGLEIEDARRNYAQSLLSDRKVSVVKSLDDLEGQSFNFIYSLHVFEHLEDLDGVIEFLKLYMPSGAFLLIEVPNFGSFASRAARRNWSHFTPEYHINHFNKESLKTLFVRHGFELKGISTFSFYHGIMSQISVFLNLFGLGGANLYVDAKKKNWRVIFFIMVLFPFAFLLEIFSSLLSQGSVLRACFVLK